jgi:hypothetical protein
MLSFVPLIGVIFIAISIYYYISKNIKLSTVFELIGNSILMVYAFYALLVLNYFIYLFFGIMFLCFLIKNIFDLKKLLGDSKDV